MKKTYMNPFAIIVDVEEIDCLTLSPNGNVEGHDEIEF